MTTDARGVKLTMVSKLASLAMVAKLFQICCNFIRLWHLSLIQVC
jgi:hypothetical protein